MKLKSHIITGIIIGAGAYSFYPSLISQYYWPGVIIGSILPDIDHPKATLSQMFFPLKIFGLIFKHRGFTHSFLAMSLLIFFGHNNLHLSATIGLGVGFFSHLIGDMLTPAGVPLFYPIKRRFRMPITFRTSARTKKRKK